MNVSFGTVVVFAVAMSAAAILLGLVWPTLSRARRERRWAMVDALLATSYIGTNQAGTTSFTPVGPPADPAPTSDSPGPDDGGPHADGAVAEDVRQAGHRTLLDAAAFEDAVHQEDAREERYRRPTTVVMLELDGLDRLVERLGDDAAARLEPDVAQTNARLARRADYVARLAPGRFAVLMPETDEIVAINYVERIRQACDQWLESGAIAMRLAIGWASTAGAASVTTAMQVAVDRMRGELRRHARSTADGGNGGAPTA